MGEGYMKILFDDFLEFIKPFDYEEWGTEGKIAFRRAAKEIWFSDWFKTEDLEKDEDFIKFMEERLREDD